MRLVDAVLRQGHLSEHALTEAIMTGDRPAHLDRCDLCTERAVELARWLDSVHSAATEAADHVFPPERLAVQQAQILRRLEQLDEPAKVIAFPTPSRPVDHPRRRVAPGWVGAAAAAGLVIGLVGGQLTARLQPAPTASTPDPMVLMPQLETPAGAQPSSVLDWELNRITPGPLDLMDEATPTMMPVSMVASQSIR